MLVDLIRGFVRSAGGSRLARTAKRLSRWLRRRHARGCLTPSISHDASGRGGDAFWGPSRKMRLRRALHGGSGQFLIIHVPHHLGAFTCNRISRAIGKGLERCLRHSPHVKGRAGLNVIVAETLKVVPRQ